VSERHRHRYELNYNLHNRFEDKGFICSGTSPDRRLVEFIELAEHPFWVGTQAHPEFKSRPDRPHPLFMGLIGASLANTESNTASKTEGARQNAVG
jgi:CTP synthase